MSLLVSAWTGTTHAAESASSFAKFLVIGISGDYDTRVQFERATVAELRRKGAAASTYYSIVAGNNPVAKEDVLAAIQTQGFDAVLVMRALDANVDLEVKKSRTEVDATTIGGGFVNLFRSDYTDYTTPGSLDLSTSVVLAIELYSAATEDIVWSMDHTTKSETNLGLLIDDIAAKIAKRLDRKKLIQK
jgi:hypothetical protein